MREQVCAVKETLILPTRKSYGLNYGTSFLCFIILLSMDFLRNLTGLFEVQRVTGFFLATSVKYTAGVIVFDNDYTLYILT